MFDDVMAQSVVPAMLKALGEVDLTYRSRALTRTVKAIKCPLMQVNTTDAATGLDVEQKVETAQFQVPTDVDTGIPEPDIRAILECNGQRWAVQSIVDISPSMATLMATRTLEYEKTSRSRK